MPHQRLATTFLLAIIPLTGCGGGGGDDPINAYRGEWSSCRSNYLIEGSSSTTWEIRRVTGDAASLRILERRHADSKTCAGEGEVETYAEGTLTLAGTKEVSGAPWDRVLLVFAGQTRRELASAAGASFATTAPLLTVHEAESEGPRDEEGYPDRPGTQTLTRK